jgi:hypothetical protein
MVNRYNNKKRRKKETKKTKKLVKSNAVLTEMTGRKLTQAIDSLKKNDSGKSTSECVRHA